MTILDKLERRFGRFAVPQLTLYIVVMQVVFYLLQALSPDSQVFANLALVPAKVLAGEVYRIAAFVFTPPGRITALGAVGAFFFWYLLYLFGTAMENHWGSFRYNVFLLVGYAITVASVFVQPHSMLPTPNDYLLGSIFLAFAFLYPQFELRLFFVLPVPVKYIAALFWIVYGGSLIGALFLRDWTTAIAVAAPICNFLLFFGHDVLDKLKQAERRAVATSRETAEEELSNPFHQCAICGITDISHPDMDFRYYDGGRCYCMDHINEHGA